jgi:Lrp/AsnC family transcriptional regulator for asnA, asnC and gidA
VFVKLTKTDLAIISALEQNGRLSYRQLAHQLRISVPTVTRRLHALLKNKVVTINAVPNPYKLGYGAQAIIGMNVPMNSLNDICKKLLNNYNVSFLSTTFGRFNLIIFVQFVTWEKLVFFLSSELPELGDISERETYFIKEPQKIFFGFPMEQAGKEKSFEPDEVDQKIMEELFKDGRYSCLNLAKKLKMSSPSVFRRLSYLLDDNIIKIRAIAHSEAIGGLAISIVFIRVEHKELNSILRKLNSRKEVRSLFVLVNGYDICASIIAQDITTLFELTGKIMSEIKGISTIETLVHGTTIKQYYGLAEELFLLSNR